MCGPLWSPWDDSHHQTEDHRGQPHGHEGSELPGCTWGKGSKDGCGPWAALGWGTHGSWRRTCRTRCNQCVPGGVQGCVQAGDALVSAAEELEKSQESSATFTRSAGEGDLHGHCRASRERGVSASVVTLRVRLGEGWHQVNNPLAPRVKRQQITSAVGNSTVLPCGQCDGLRLRGGHWEQARGCWGQAQGRWDQAWGCWGQAQGLWFHHKPLFLGAPSSSALASLPSPEPHAVRSSLWLTCL